MPSVRVLPVRLAALEAVSGVEPLGESDADCLVAIRAILEMHGKLDRFGVALLPADVPCDGRERLLTSRADKGASDMPLTDLSPAMGGAVWKLQESGSHMLLWGKPSCNDEPLHGE
ncbi:hypothetical protein [Henriciella aquimarina]|uniref:hypothetical protein n=1 Tax=Henriciella aquimarina TaxID=545261 RepID=UPI001179AFAD|nr:hypothetical protein [Henriciella aquimarina]